MSASRMVSAPAISLVAAGVRSVGVRRGAFLRAIASVALIAWVSFGLAAGRPIRAGGVALPANEDDSKRGRRLDSVHRTQCIDRFRNDLIEIASIGTVLRQSSCPIESPRSPVEGDLCLRSRVLPQSRARDRTEGQAASAGATISPVATFSGRQLSNRRPSTRKHGEKA